MLTVEACRRLVGPSLRELSDADIRRLRDDLTDIARLAVTSFVGARRPAESAVLGLAEDDRIEVEERAAVLEFDANMSRDDATRRALASRPRRASRMKPPIKRVTGKS